METNHIEGEVLLVDAEVSLAGDVVVKRGGGRRDEVAAVTAAAAAVFSLLTRCQGDSGLLYRSANSRVEI